MSGLVPLESDPDWTLSLPVRAFEVSYVPAVVLANAPQNFVIDYPAKQWSVTKAPPRVVIWAECP